MKRFRVPVIVGTVWGVICLFSFIFLLGEDPPSSAVWLSGYDKTNFLIEALGADYIGPFILPYLPYFVGLDLSTWTLGLIFYAFGYGSWPGQALGIVLSAHPVLAWVVAILFMLLGGVVCIGVPYLVSGLVRIISKSEQELDWGSALVGTITLVMALQAFAQLTAPRGNALAMVLDFVGIPALFTGILLPLKHKKLDYNFWVGIIGIFFGLTLLSGTLEKVLSLTPLLWSVYSIWFIIYAVRGLLQTRTYRTTAPSQYSVLMILNFLLLVLGLLGTIIPFFTLNSLPLVVAIALIIESLITWLE